MALTPTRPVRELARPVPLLRGLARTPTTMAHWKQQTVPLKEVPFTNTHIFRGERPCGHRVHVRSGACPFATGGGARTNNRAFRDDLAVQRHGHFWVYCKSRQC